MSRSRVLGLFLCIPFAAIPVISQNAPVGTVRTQIEGIEIPPIAGAPFTAKVVVTWNRPEIGGGTASREYYTTVARDSQGRVRREIREFVPANSIEEPPLRSFTILDPVAGTRTTCTKEWMTCASATFDPALALRKNAADQSAAGRESLGQQTIEGLPATGTRQTLSNVSGPGGDRLAISRTDAWYSPDLHMNLAVTRTDPQLGVVTLQVTNLRQGEPDSTLFAIPAGYTLRNKVQ
jgi:hypothetical protein